jgi:ABC-2 type transport system permease protein
MPDAMQVMGWISPHTWALMAYQDVLMRGAGVPAVLPEVAILLAFAAVFFSFAAWRFRWA